MQRPTVVDATTLSNSFLGNLIQVCVVTGDWRQTVDAFVNLGIGPWSVRTVDASTVSGFYRDTPADFEARLCLANSRNMNWEVIQPLRGRSIYAEFLERNAGGVQHLAFNCDGIAYDERLRHFRERGYRPIQHGVIFGGIDFHYLEGQGGLGTVVEIYRVPPAFSLPPPEEWIPAPPP